MDAKMTDAVNRPDHYARYRFECEPKDLTKFLPHPLASAIEYIIRAPFKGSELEDLQKARFWLLEFVNTTEFWVVPFGSSDDNPFCRLLPDPVDDLMASASAFALISRCNILRFGLFDYHIGRFDFPRAIHKSQVLSLIDKVNEKIDEIESKTKPSE
jgi:hypothetical protein|nr:MAG TPA: nucelotide kinase [Caudoviricetes sp.]